MRTHTRIDALREGYYLVWCREVEYILLGFDVLPLHYTQWDEVRLIVMLRETHFHSRA